MTVPKIALVMGDAAGVGIELAARLLAAAFRLGRPELLDLGHNGAGDIPQGVPTAESGAFAMKNFGMALDLAKAGAVDAICFTPFNKQALKLDGNPYLDEIHWAADRLGFSGRCSEYNR